MRFNDHYSVQVLSCGQLFRSVPWVLFCFVRGIGVFCSVTVHMRVSHVARTIREPLTPQTAPWSASPGQCGGTFSSVSQAVWRQGKTLHGLTISPKFVSLQIDSPQRHARILNLLWPVFCTCDAIMKLVVRRTSPIPHQPRSPQSASEHSTAVEVQIHILLPYHALKLVYSNLGLVFPGTLE